MTIRGFRETLLRDRLRSAHIPCRCVGKGLWRRGVQVDDDAMGLVLALSGKDIFPRNSSGLRKVQHKS
ncbi:MAG: hypothetical protein R3C46_00555 [Hyphomonadaceae bacterium]